MKNTDDDEEGAVNTGSNLFVTGIHPSLSEQQVSAMFEKYGQVENCSIMLDPHTKESRGFGFVKMVTSQEADAAREGLQGEVIEGRTLSIEKARRARPRTPTPGKYFGPPKRGKSGPIFSTVQSNNSEGDHRGPPGRGGGYRDRYDDRRGGGYGGGRRDDYGGGYRDRYDDRRGGGYGGGRRDDYGGGRRDRDDNYSGGGRIDRYESRRDDSYTGGGGRGGGGYSSRGGDDYAPPPRERRGGGGGGGYYDREERGYGAPPPRDAPPPREAYAEGGRDYGREDRYPAR